MVLVFQNLTSHLYEGENQSCELSVNKKLQPGQLGQHVSCLCFNGQADKHKTFSLQSKNTEECYLG